MGSGVIAVAMGLMNLGTYGFTILAAQLLGPVEYGALAAVMGLLLIVNVASLGLQATAARRVSATPTHTAAIEADILAASYRTALGLGAVCLLVSPLVSAALDLDSWVTAALLAITVVPLTVMGGQAGVLQGEERWLPLALIYVAAGIGRLLFGAVALLVDPHALGAMVGVAVGAFLPTLIGWAALRHPSRAPEGAPAHGSASTTMTHGPGSTQAAEPPPPGGLLRELTHNSHALLAFFALSNADVVVARVVLDSHDSGLYAAGLILAKAVLFLPQFVVVIAFPSMSKADADAQVHLRGLATVLGIGAVTTLGVALLSPLAVRFVGGVEYAEVESALWAFAVLGTLLAVLQLMIYAVVARQDQRSVFFVWAAFVVVVSLAHLTGTVTGLLVVVTVVDAVLLLVLLTRVLGRAPVAPEHQRGAPVS